MPKLTPTASTQLDLIDLVEFDGYGGLTRRERLFAEAIFEGCTQRAAAKLAGVTGSDEVLDNAASRLMRHAGVQRILAQAWKKSGASIHRSLSQAAELQQRAFHEAIHADTAERRREAHRQWKDATTLIASIHGKLSVLIDGDVNHHHDGVVGVATVPASALADFAKAHREVVIAQLDNTHLPAPLPTSPHLPHRP